MPSRTCASPTRHVGEPMARRAWNDRENFFSAALHEDEDGTELALDFQGYRHVDTCRNGDEVYALQNDESSTHLKIEMPGQFSADALRDYLSNLLLSNQIVDEYGYERDMSWISNDHLAVLQAKIWSKIPNGRLATKLTSSRPSLAQLSIAYHVATISRLLEGVLSTSS
jgi:hypothetical protein